MVMSPYWGMHVLTVFTKKAYRLSLKGQCLVSVQCSPPVLHTRTAEDFCPRSNDSGRVKVLARLVLRRQEYHPEVCEAAASTPWPKFEATVTSMWVKSASSLERKRTTSKQNSIPQVG